MLDQVVDDYGPVLDGLQDDIDEIEVQVFGGDPECRERIYQLTREVIEFHRAVEPLHDIFDAAARGSSARTATSTDLELRRRMRDVEDHATRVLERVENFRELLTNLLNVQATLVGAAAERRDGAAHRGGLRAERAGQADLVVGGDRLRADARGGGSTG